MSEHGYTGSVSGPATDRHNEPVIDPTKNVDALVELNVKRLDDLRKLDSLWRDKMDKTQIDHIWEMRKAESDRIDAILDAAAANVQRAADVQSGVAERLAGQVVETATAFEGRLRAALAPLEETVADLRRTQYQDVGAKTQVVETRDVGRNSAMWIGIGLTVVGLGFTAASALIAVAAYIATH